MEFQDFEIKFHFISHASLEFRSGFHKLTLLKGLLYNIHFYIIIQLDSTRDPKLSSLLANRSNTRFAYNEYLKHILLTKYEFIM